MSLALTDNPPVTIGMLVIGLTIAMVVILRDRRKERRKRRDP